MTLPRLPSRSDPSGVLRNNGSERAAESFSGARHVHLAISQDGSVSRPGRGCGDANPSLLRALAMPHIAPPNRVLQLIPAMSRINQCEYEHSGLCGHQIGAVGDNSASIINTCCLLQEHFARITYANQIV
jgi:hypothetical protein